MKLKTPDLVKYWNHLTQARFWLQMGTLRDLQIQYSTGHETGIPSGWITNPLQGITHTLIFIYRMCNLSIPPTEIFGRWKGNQRTQSKNALEILHRQNSNRGLWSSKTEMLPADPPCSHKLDFPSPVIFPYFLWGLWNLQPKFQLLLGDSQMFPNRL